MSDATIIRGPSLIDAIASLGLTAPPKLYPGRWLKLSTNGRPKDDAGSVKLLADGCGALIKNHKTNENWTFWFDAEDEKPDIDNEARRKAAEAASRIRQEADNTKHVAAAWKANHLLAAASPANADHTYLIRKQVTPNGLLELPVGEIARRIGYAPQAKGRPLTGRILLAPVVIGDGLSTVEMIDENGLKAALAGGKKAGAWWAEYLSKGDGTGDTIAISEGVATAKTIGALTGWHVVAALSCGNLTPVAQALRQRFPTALLVICADKGRGKLDAQRAAITANARLLVPVFQAELGGTDFNDLASIDPAEAKRQLLGEAAKPEADPLAAIGTAVIMPTLGPDLPAKATDFNDLATLAGREEVARQIAYAIKTSQLEPEMDGGEVGDDTPPIESMGEARPTRKRPSKSTRPLIPTDRPEIRIIAGQLPEIVDAAENALIRRGGFYQRGAFLVRPGWSRITIHGGSSENPHSTEAMRIISVKVPTIAEMMTSAATFSQYDARSEEWHPKDCPARVADTYAARSGQWKVPTLTGIVQAPTLRPDGTILDLAGYDASTGLLFDPAGVKFPNIPLSPTRDDAIAALGKLKALIQYFPFVTDADRSVALSGFLTVLVRRSLPSAPIHGYTAPTAGSGKSLLVDGAAILATGKPASVIAQGEKVEEFEKGLGSCLIAGDQIISIDNCEAPLGGVLLCQCLTQQVVKPRILGQSLNPDVVSNAAMYATGNNLTFIGDMTRRSLLCSLDPKCERPELRVFDFDVIEEATKNRPSLVVAGLTILRAYVVAGKPNQKISPFGSFEAWSRLVRASLIWLEEADPLETADTIRASDPVLDQLRQVFSAWRSVIGLERVTVKDVIERVTAQPDSDLREALLTVAGSGGVVNSRMLGKWLARHKNRIVDGLSLQAGPKFEVDPAVWTAMGRS